MKNVQAQLKRDWRLWREHQYHKTKMDVSLYDDKKLFNMVQLALCFWQFVKSIDLFNDVGGESVKREFLMNYVNQENTLFALVAKIEMLPDTIWRKVLWRHNIDFLSLESFLRRISAEQQQAIVQNWNDIYGEKPRTPSVLLLTVRDCIWVLIHYLLGKLGITIQLYNSSIRGMAGSRYYSKAAWAYNLALLDFGFAKYPNGTQNDVEITNRSALRFLSTKNHVNDFVVNQDDGIYWFFYKFARSRMWIFKDSDDVRLSAWICPGFWKTLILNAWFWLGPLSLLMLISYESLYWIHWLFMGISAGFMALWITVVSIVLLVFGIKKAFESMSERFDNSMNSFFTGLKPIGLIAIIIVIALAACGLVYCLFEVFTYICRTHEILYARFWAICGVSLTFYVVSLLLHWLLYKVGTFDGKTDKHIIKQRWLLKSFLGYVGAWILFLIVLFRVPIGEFLVASGHSLVDLFHWFMSHYFIIMGTVGLLVSLYYLSQALLGYLDFEKFLVTTGRNIAMLILGITCSTLLVYLLYDNADVSFVFKTLVYVAVVYWIIIAFFVVSTLQLLRQDTVYYATKGFKEYLRMDGNSLSYDWSNLKGLKKKLWMSKYMRLVEGNTFFNEARVVPVLDVVSKIGMRYFGETANRFVFMTRAISKMNENLFTSLLLVDANYQLYSFEPYDNADKAYFFQLLLNGNQPDRAYQMVVTAYYAREAAKVGLTKSNRYVWLRSIWKAIKWFFYYGTWPIWFSAKKLTHFFGDLYQFGRVMYKDACPYVQKPEKL